MTSEQVFNLIAEFCEGTNQFHLNLERMNDQDGKRYYNEILKNNVEYRYGIYFICDSVDSKVLYIGKAGTLKNDGLYKSQNLIGRLNAPRGKYNNSFLHFKEMMNDNNFDNMIFRVFYSKNNFPPAYLEAIALYNFYKTQGKLPKFNNEY
jgi:hypothetical protein